MPILLVLMLAGTIWMGLNVGGLRHERQLQFANLGPRGWESSPDGLRGYIFFSGNNSTVILSSGVLPLDR